jgi:hypothetical protein
MAKTPAKKSPGKKAAKKTAAKKSAVAGGKRRKKARTDSYASYVSAAAAAARARSPRTADLQGAEAGAPRHWRVQEGATGSNCHFCFAPSPALARAPQAMVIMDNFIRDVFERLSSEAGRLSRYNKKVHIFTASPSRSRPPL